MALHFIRPEWLWALLPLALILLLLWRQKGNNTDWNRYIPSHLSMLLVDEGQLQKRNTWYYLAFSWLIATLALSGPALFKQNLPVFAKNQGRVLVMDMSLSMYATDLTPNRLTQARFRAIDLLNGIKEGETGLVIYAGDAFVISPLTQDNGTLLNLLPTLSPEIMPVRGSNMASAIKQAQQLLSQGGHLSGDIIIFTDGISNKDFDASMALTQASPYRLGVLAIGSKTGAPIKLPNGQLQRDTSNEVVVAQTNFELLSELANSSDGQLFIAQANASDTGMIINWLHQEGETQETELTGETWQDLGPYLALLLLVPALLNFRHSPMLILAAMLIIPAPNALANTWDDLWQTQNQQAMEKYHQGQYDEAAEQFEHEQWQANAHYKAGDYQKALEGFEKDSSAQGLYNQGNALMQQHKFSEAKQKYQQALELDSNLAQAEKNKTLAEKLEKQQKQNQQGSGDQDSNKQDSKESDQNNQDPNQQNPDQQNNPDQQSADEQNSNGQQNSDQNSSKQEQSEQEQNQQQSDESQQQQNQDSQSSQQNDNQMQASSDEKSLSEQEQEQESETGQQQAKQTNAQAKQSDENDSEQNQAMTSSQASDETEALPPEMERALQAISEDPQLLLRNKMELEYRKRRQRGELTQESQSW